MKGSREEQRVSRKKRLKQGQRHIRNGSPVSLISSILQCQDVLVAVVAVEGLHLPGIAPAADPSLICGISFLQRRNVRRSAFVCHQSSQKIMSKLLEDIENEKSSLICALQQCNIIETNKKLKKKKNKSPRCRVELYQPSQASAGVRS